MNVQLVCCLQRPDVANDGAVNWSEQTAMKAVVKLGDLGSHTDRQTHAGSAFYNRVTLTFDLRVNAF